MHHGYCPFSRKISASHAHASGLPGRVRGSGTSGRGSRWLESSVRGPLGPVEASRFGGLLSRWKNGAGRVAHTVCPAGNTRRAWHCPATYRDSGPTGLSLSAQRRFDAPGIRVAGQQRSGQYLLPLHNSVP